MSNVLSWSKHLIIKRGGKILNQTLRMYKFHSYPFDKIMNGMFDVLDKYNSNFTFPLTASSGLAHPDMVELLKNSGNEITIHGFKHVRYDFLPAEKQIEEFELAIRAFKQLKIPYSGFRTPYNKYDETTELLVEKYGFKWDGGIGYRPENQRRTEFFTTELSNGKKSSYTCIPLSIWSDDYMIDYLAYTPKKIAETLIKAISNVLSSKGVIMFDLHPVRIGQKGYLSSLDATLDYCRKKDIWVPNVNEAVDYWNKHKKWKGDASACCLMTGDIDNFTFWDYLRRF